MTSRYGLLLMIFGLAAFLTDCRKPQERTFDFARAIEDSELAVGSQEVDPESQRRLRLDQASLRSGGDSLTQAGGTSRSYYIEIPPAERHPRLVSECEVPVVPAGVAATFGVEIAADGQVAQKLFEATLTAGRTCGGDVDLTPWARRVCRLTFNVAGQAPLGQWVKLVLLSDRVAAPVPVAEDPRAAAARNRLAASNVIIVLLDAARPSHFGAYGYRLATTPNIDRIAGEGLLFTKAYCNAVYTEASTGSLLTGTYPDVHRVLYDADRLPPAAYTLPKMLAASGVQTAAFVGNGMAGTLRGFEQGFALFDELFRHPEYAGRCVNQNVWLFPWIEANRARHFFLYLHFFEPHFGFSPPKEFLDRFRVPYRGTIDPLRDRHAVNHGERGIDAADIAYLQSIYDANLSYADYEIGLIRKRLEELGLWRSTLLLITADHGEAFYEHQMIGHNGQVYENMAHIPLIAHLPDGVRAGGPGRIDSLVETIDLFATLAEAAGSEEGRKRAEGRSLLELLSVPGASRPGLVVTRTVGKQPTYGLRDGRWEYVFSTRNRVEELYDLEADPGEARDMHESLPALSGYFRQLLRGWLRREQARAAGSAAPVAAQIDDASRQNLIGLGYIDPKTGEPTQ